jgi:hypothetical protein
MKGKLHAQAVLSLEKERWHFISSLPIVIYSLILILDSLVLFRNDCLSILPLQCFVFLSVLLPSFLSQNIHFCVLMSRPTCSGITRLTNWIFSWACHVNERKVKYLPIVLYQKRETVCIPPGKPLWSVFMYEEPTSCKKNARTLVFRKTRQSDAIHTHGGTVKPY